MSSDIKILPQASWPFLLDSIQTQSDRQVAKAIYDLQLSLIVPRQVSYVHTGKWFYIRLTSTTSSTITFSLHNTKLDTTDTITCDISSARNQGGLVKLSHQFEDSKEWLDESNCFIQFSENLPAAQNLNLQVCASCIMLSSACAKIKITWGKVHRRGIIQQSTDEKQLDTLVFQDGYNAQVSYKDNKLTINAAPGYGNPLQLSYANWVQYQQTASSIQSYRAGAKSINGLIGNVYIQPGPSISIIPQLSNTSLTLNLKAHKNTDQSQEQQPDIQSASVQGNTP